MSVLLEDLNGNLKIKTDRTSNYAEVNIKGTQMTTNACSGLAGKLEAKSSQ